MFVEQAVVGQQFVGVETVVKPLFDAAHEHPHARSAVERGNALAKSTVLATVLERDNKLVVGLEAVERVGIYGVQVAWVDKRGVDTLVGQQTCHTLTLLVERTSGNDSHPAAAVHHLVAWFVAIFRVDGGGGMVHPVGGYAQRNGHVVLGNGPA